MIKDYNTTYIDPEKYYNVSDIWKHNFFPWIKSISTIKKWIELDMQTNNHLQATKKLGLAPTGVRYYIKGKNIINFVAKFNDGSLSFEPQRKG